VIAVRDVTLRDGLQDETPVGTAGKVALFEALVAAGVTDLELTSFVRPDRVPAMADADDLAARTTPATTAVRRWGLVLNERGAQRALAAGLRHLQFVLSVSEPHNLENAGQTVDRSLAQLADIVVLAAAHDADVEVTLATAFGCPYAGPVAPDLVATVGEGALALDVAGLTLADTIGTAVPTEVRTLVARIRAVAAGTPLGIHLHDTRGLALANALAAVDEGIDRIDATVGGLGGCPFAPGASGNLPLEDLVHALHAMGLETGLDLDGLLAAARLACELVGRPVGSHVGIAGPRFAGTPHALALAAADPPHRQT
jgi:hydroxymethylglutaryl-CoA lyase